jgi:5-methylcytosine-specific restriction endonuclease McrA|nr:MAG TPA: NinG recombination protein [Caudoviricetes sp.]
MYTAEQITKLIADGNKKKFYDDSYWINLSNRILQRDGNECQECKKEGKLTIKQHDKKLDVHHIKELETNPELAYIESNLETVCVHHHNILDNKKFNVNKKEKFMNEERW